MLQIPRLCFFLCFASRAVRFEFCFVLFALLDMVWAGLVMHFDFYSFNQKSNSLKFQNILGIIITRRTTKLGRFYPLDFPPPKESERHRQLHLLRPGVEQQS